MKSPTCLKYPVRNIFNDIYLFIKFIYNQYKFDDRIKHSNQNSVQTRAFSYENHPKPQNDMIKIYIHFFFVTSFYYVPFSHAI